MNTSRITHSLGLASAILVFTAACQSTARHDSVAHASSPAVPIARENDEARGYLLIVGGGGTTPEMYKRMLGAAGGNDAKVVILPQASEMDDTGAESVKVWKERGATNVEWLDLVDPKRDAEKIRAARVIWFPGGVQTRLMAALDKAGVTELVRQRHKDGAVVGGTSAGAAVMTRVMITGEYDMSFKAKGAPAKPASDEAPGASSPSAPGATPPAAKGASAKDTPPAAKSGAKDTPPVAKKETSDTPPTSGTPPTDPASPAARTPREDEDSGLRYVRHNTNVFAEGLGLLDGAIVDQHFVRRQRFNRLLSAVLDHPELLGIGIDEKTSIFVHDGGFEVIGASNVLVVDARRAEEVDRDVKLPGAARGLALHVLRDGMRFDLGQR